MITTSTSSAAGLIAQDVRMWAQNIYFLIGVLIFGSICAVILIGLYIGLRVWIFKANQDRSMAEYYKRTRRADGKMYPPFAVGICEQCKGIRKKVYHLHTGERLCPECYEPFWRSAEKWTEPPPAEPEELPLIARVLKRVMPASAAPQEPSSETDPPPHEK